MADTTKYIVVQNTLNDLTMAFTFPAFTPKQKAIARKKMTKYTGQLLNIARSKIKAEPGWLGSQED